MRVVDATGKFGSTRALSGVLPATPAAVPIYARARTELLAFDFDAKGNSPAEVDADVDRLVGWVEECGGRWITDRSTSGGRHVLVPLSSGSALRVEPVATLMRLLAARLPTLDITPMLNPATGCITAPGSACREGGHRVLLGSVTEALDTLTVRSSPGLVARLVATLGGGAAPRATSPAGTASGAVRAAAAEIDYHERTTGSGEEVRLASVHHRREPMPAPVAAYAATGHLDTSRWRSHSEARQSVLTHAVLRGASASDIRGHVCSPEWAGVRRAYARYADPDTALARDAAHALTWAAANVEQFRNPAHEYKHTGGDGSFLDDEIRRRWLAHALVWADREFVGNKSRPFVGAVLQALAYASALMGEIVEGVPVVAMGGRGLSHAAGLVPETTVFDVLRVVRDMVGSPVLLVARGAGQLADRYALTSPAAPAPTGVQLAAARVEPVHPAWSVLGMRCRRVYEDIARRTDEASSSGDSAARTRGAPGSDAGDSPAGGEGFRPADVFAAARIGESSGYEILADLIGAGLIVKHRAGSVSMSSRTLDEVAGAAGVARMRRERIVRHRAERVVWHAWLEQRFAPPPPDVVAAEPPDTVWVPVDAADVAVEHECYWVSVLATGPPEDDDAGRFVEFDPTANAIALLAELLGARVLS